MDVLDSGFVELDEFSGGDLTIVNSARISYARKHNQMDEGDDKLIGFLMQHRHGTPFETSHFLFHIKAPIFVAREWMRHRMASYNEVSARYTKLEQEFYLPEGDAIRKQVGKPGRYVFKPLYDPAKEHAVRSKMRMAYSHASEAYEDLLNMGVAKEVARDVLPVAIYTEFYFDVNARSLMNFLSLRNAPNALYEIQEYAKGMEHYFAKKMPICYNAFVQNERVAP